MSEDRSSQARLQRSAPSEPVLGVVESIAEGLSLVLAYPLVILVPLAVDVGLWSGFSISPAALLQRFAAVGDAADALGYSNDVLPLVALGLPSLLSTVEPGRAFEPWSRTTLEPGAWQATALTIAALVLASTLLGTIFRIPLAVVIRFRERSPRQLVVATGVAWFRLLGLFAIVAASIVLIASPMLIGGAIFLAIGIDVMPLITAALVIPGIAAAVYLMFTPEAIVLTEVGPLRAAYLSFNVVRRNFWPAIGLLASVLLITEGLSVLWRSNVGTPIGLLIGMLGNAFIGAGLGLAAMRFYDDRLRRWRPDQSWTGPPSSPG